jgi:DNA modification methylase
VDVPAMILVQDADFTLHVGDVLEQLAVLPDESVHCVVTSPPFWGLRDYGTGRWEGGSDSDPCPDCTTREEQLRCKTCMGSGTVALVARRLGRKSVGIELNPEYARLCARRLQQLSLLAGAPDG